MQNFRRRQGPERTVTPPSVIEGIIVVDGAEQLYVGALPVVSYQKKLCACHGISEIRCDCPGQLARGESGNVLVQNTAGRFQCRNTM